MGSGTTDKNDFFILGDSLKYRGVQESTGAGIGKYRGGYRQVQASTGVGIGKYG